MYRVTKEGMKNLLDIEKRLGEELINIFLEKKSSRDSGGELEHDNPSIGRLKLEEIAIIRRLKEVRGKIKSAVITDTDNEENLSKNVVTLGSLVEVEFSDGEEGKYTVQDQELIIIERRRDIISYESPLGKALLGRHKGDVVRYSVGENEFEVKIKSVK